VSVEAVLFDWGGTLSVHVDVDLLDMWRAAARHLAPDDPEPVAAALLAAEQRWWQESVAVGDRSGTTEQLVRSVARDTSLDVVAALRAYHDAWELTVAHDPAAVPVLTALRERGLRTGLLSNTHWPRELHERWLADAGLLDLLDVRLYTSGMTHMKPHARRSARWPTPWASTRRGRSSSATGCATTSPGRRRRHAHRPPGRAAGRGVRRRARRRARHAGRAGGPGGRVEERMTVDPEQVAYAGVTGQLALLRSGRITAVELLRLCLARIDRLDGRLNAFRTVFSDSALAEAAAADAARAAGDERPLLGVPVAVKDNVAVAGHASAMGTGSTEPTAGDDAAQVRRLREAGAVVVGTTHLPELALWPFTESQTWGATRNPWSTGHTTGGSSGGSAAAVAAGMVAAATASDGGGSIRIPAAACGLVGLKPQRDRVPLAPLAEHWHGLSVAGVLTRTVEDSALVLSVLTDGALSADLAPPDALRIAWSTRAPLPTPVHPDVEAALQEVLGVLRGLGHDVSAGEPVYGRVQPSFLLRYLAGARDDLRALAQPRRTEPRTASSPGSAPS
jgi:amidase